MTLVKMLKRLNNSIYPSELASLPFPYMGNAIMFTYRADEYSDCVKYIVEKVKFYDNDGNIKTINVKEPIYVILDLSDADFNDEKFKEPQYFPVDYIELVGELEKEPKSFYEVELLAAKAEYEYILPLYYKVLQYLDFKDRFGSI